MCEMVAVVLRKKKIIVDGKEYEVEEFDTKIMPGSGKELEAVDALLREEEIEREIRTAIKKIATLADEYTNKEKDVWYYYKVGRVLWFVDSKGFVEERHRIWERMAANLRPDIFFGKTQAPKDPKKYPEIMYRLGKQKKNSVGRLKWAHWFEILQQPTIYGDQKKLELIIDECQKKDLTKDELREKIQELNKARR